MEQFIVSDLEKLMVQVTKRSYFVPFRYDFELLIINFIYFYDISGHDIVSDVAFTYAEITIYADRDIIRVKFTNKQQLDFFL